MNKNEVISRIEHILSYLLSNKHGASIKIAFKKENNTNGNTNKTGDIKKEQILDRQT